MRDGSKMLTVVWIIFEPVKKAATITLAKKEQRRKKLHPTEFNVVFIIIKYNGFQLSVESNKATT